MTRTPRLALAATTLALALTALAAPAQAAVNAHGSVEQVYVTKLEPGTETTLLNADGKAVKTKKADAQGGLIFRNVKPGDGYKVRVGSETSDALTVLTQQSAPPSEDVYNQEIPSKGYGYMTMRDGTKLAYYVHPPTDVSNATPVGTPVPNPGQPTPTLIEYSGYGYANPAGPQSGISIVANIFGFTVVDVNMRGTGCWAGRSTSSSRSEPRRLRHHRDRRAPAVGAARQGRDDGHLLRRHQPAVHRADAAAEPLGDHADLADRSDADDALPGRHPQHRVRLRVGQAARRGGRAGRTRGGPGSALGLGEDPGGRRGLQGEPGAPRAGAGPDQQGQGQRHLPAEGGRPAVAAHVRRQDQRADVHGLPVPGRADGRPLPDALHATDRYGQEVGHVGRTAPTSTRSPPRRSTAGTTSSSYTWQRKRRSWTRPRSAPRRRWSTRRRSGSRASLCRPTRFRSSPPTRERSRRSRNRT